MTSRITARNDNTALIAKRQRELKRNHVRSQSISYDRSSSPSNRTYRQRGTLAARSSTKVVASVVKPTLSGPLESRTQASPFVSRIDMSNFYGLPTFDDQATAPARSVSTQHPPSGGVAQPKPAPTDSLTALDRVLMGMDLIDDPSAASIEAAAQHQGTLDSTTWDALPMAQRMQLASSFAAPQLSLPLEVLKGKPLMKAIRVLGDLKDVQSALQNLESSQAEFAKVQKRLADTMARSGADGTHSGSFRDLTARMPVIIDQMKKLDTALWALSADSWSLKTASENAREAVKQARASLASSIKNLEAIHRVA